MQLYDQIYLKLDGALIAENTTVETGLEADHQPAMTNPKGYAGMTPSPVTRVVRATVLMPRDNPFEYPFEDKFLANELVTCTLESGVSGKVMISNGFLYSVSINAGVGQNVEISFEFRGEPAAFS